MRILQAFDPLEVGEIDSFVFDFTSDIGNASMLSTSWTALFINNQIATDPNPQNIVLGSSVATSFAIRSPIDGLVTTKTGFFSIASIGGMPSTAQGGTYILEATLNLSDGRILKLNSTVICAAPGQ